MTYPKPLSKNNLRKLYEESGITDKESEFLHALFRSCANLYGIITVQEIFEIFEACAERNYYPKISRSKLMKFSGIVRREALTYNVYEFNELYSLERQRTSERRVVRKDMIIPGYYRFMHVWDIDEKRTRYQVYIPEDILAFQDDPASAGEMHLLQVLDQLVSTAAEIKGSAYARAENPNRGKALKDFSFVSHADKALADYYQNKKGIYAKSWNEQMELSRTLSASVHFLQKHKEREQYHPDDFNENLRRLLDDLEEAGVELTEAGFRTLVDAAVDLHNSIHSWYRRGWSPKELHRQSTGGTPEIQFGRNIEKMIADGVYSREELVQHLEQAGIKVSNASKHGKN